jgi:hypothetical protein
MGLKSIIKAPENAMLVGLAEVAVIYSLYQKAVPNDTDVRAASALDRDVEAARRHAAWTSAILIGLVFLITGDINSTVIGGAGLAGIDLMTKHANGVNPNTGKLTGRETEVPDNDVAFALPSYDDDTQDDTAMADVGY